MTIEQKFITTLQSLTKTKNFYIGFSGGLDSIALVHLLVNYRRQHKSVQLTAVHVNHSISKSAIAWSRYCQKICKQLKVKYCETTVDARKTVPDYSPEEIARKLRYQAFAEILPKQAALITAHHADDQAETLLLQLFRGAGVKGLAAMPEKKIFASGYLLRPLLQITRQELLEYAQAHKLKWIEDESNLEVKYARNFIRQKIFPLLKLRWPGIITTINRVAKHCAVADRLLGIIAEQDYAAMLGSIAGTLSVTKLKSLDLERRNNVLRYWIQTLNLPLPPTHKIAEISCIALTARGDAKPLITWCGGEVRRFQDNLYALPPLPPHDSKIVLHWDVRKSLKLPSGLGVLKTKILDRLRNIDCTKITVRFRQGGEVIRLPNRNHSCELKKLMQTWNIPPWQRDRIPLVYCGERIIAVVGYIDIVG